jgi:hypothetical protein
MKFIRERITWSTDALSQRVAALDHEALDHAMKDHAIVVRLLHLLARPWIGPLLGAFREADEVLYGFRYLLIVETDGEVSFAGDELCIDSRQRWLLVTVEREGVTKSRGYHCLAVQFPR